MRNSKLGTVLMVVIIFALFGASIYMATTNTSITDLLDVSVADLPDATDPNGSNSGLDPAGPGLNCSCSGVADINQGCAAFGCPEGTKRVCGCISSEEKNGVCTPSYGDCACVQDSACSVVEDPVVTDTGTGGDNNNSGSGSGSGASVCTPNATRAGTCGQGNCSASFRYIEVCNSAGSAYEFSECRFDSACGTVEPDDTQSNTVDDANADDTNTVTPASVQETTTSNLPDTAIDETNLQIFAGICLTVLGIVLLSNSKIFRKNEE